MSENLNFFLKLSNIFGVFAFSNLFFLPHYFFRIGGWGAFSPKTPLITMPLIAQYHGNMEEIS